MQRRQLVVGDPPAGGGRILPYVPPFPNCIMGHQVAIVGGRVYCEACGSVGVIAKAGGLRRSGYITEVALEGDLCVCGCPEPQPLISRLQSASSCDDTFFGGAALPLWEPGNQQHLVSSRLVEDQVKQSPDALQDEKICPNMSNEAFATLVMELRDEAAQLVRWRLEELGRWDEVAKDRILEWFGDPGLSKRNLHLSELRLYLGSGMDACARVLKSLKAGNFIRWVPGWATPLGCSGHNPPGLAAQVCKPDIETRTIAISLGFCGLRRSNAIHGTDKSNDRDSQLSTLIHEVTHFKDVFASTDDWYYMREARKEVLESKRFDIARVNADSLTGYIMGATE